MKPIRRSIAFASILAASLPLMLALPLLAAKPINTTLFGGLAIEGYDPVAYFQAGAPAKGSKSFTYEWGGANWRFSSAENRDLFAAAPEKYAPQYGGFCAYAVSQGKTVGIDPAAWTIVEDKLYLNYNQKIRQTWEKDIPGYISKADAAWPKILAE
jgi:YHS domain-containing protein